MTNTTVKEILLANDIAVSLLQQRETLNAIRVLREAAEALKVLVVAVVQEGKIDNDRHRAARKRSHPRKGVVMEDDTNRPFTAEENRRRVQIGTLFTVDISNQESNYPFPVSSSNTNDSIIPLYHRAFTFVNSLSVDLDMPENKITLLGMILYNLGLAHHILGLSIGGHEVLIKEAKFSYKLARAVLDEVKNDVCIQSNMVISMGLLNNVGNIHAMQFHREEAAFCVASLRQGVVSIDSATIDALDYEFFMYSFFVPDDPCRLAPAA